MLFDGIAGMWQTTNESEMVECQNEKNSLSASHNPHPSTSRFNVGLSAKSMYRQLMRSICLHEGGIKRCLKFMSE